MTWREFAAIAGAAASTAVAAYQTQQVATAGADVSSARIGQNEVMQAFVLCELERRDCTERCGGG